MKSEINCTLRSSKSDNGTLKCKKCIAQIRFPKDTFRMFCCFCIAMKYFSGRSNLDKSYNNIKE